MRAALRHVVLSGTGGGGGAGQVGRIHIDGLVFRDETGAIWPYKGFTAFSLYLLWLIGKGAAVDPPVADWLSLPNRPNTLRVFGMVNSFARIHPQDWPGYYDELRPFVRYLFSRWGIRVAFTIFADSGEIMPDAGEQNVHADRVADAIFDEPNVFGEVANEPSQHSNLAGGDARAAEIFQRILRPGRMIATGAGDGYYPGTHVTVHTPRSLDYPRKAKDIFDVREIARVPAVADEPMGAGEVYIEGKRDTSPRNFADYAAVAQLEGAGATFHSDSGILARPLQPVQRQCAAAFFAAADWVPADAQLAPYVHGSAEGPCQWAFGESPCAHDDAIETRSYGKLLDPRYYVSQVQTLRDHPTPCPGWTVDAPGPSIGLTRFRRA